MALMGAANRSPTPPGRAFDPGLQAERTALAWTRTAAAVGVNALLTLRAGLTQDRPWVMRLGAVLLLAAIAVAIYSVVRRHQLRCMGTPAAISVCMVTCATVLALVACLVGSAGFCWRD